jgi:nucleolar protein 56
VKATIIECVMGIFAFGESNQLVKVILFPKDATKIAEKLEKTETGKVIDEIAKVVKSLQTKEYEQFIFERSELAANAREKLKINTEAVKTSEAGELLRGNLDKIAVESGFTKHEGEIRGWLHRVSMELTKLRVKKAAEKRDLVVAQAIQTVDDLDKTLNLFVERIREWYGLHFPELDRLIDKHETFLRLVANLGQRENFTEESLTKEGLPKAKVQATAKVAERSMGAELQEQDLHQIQTMCKNTLELHDVRHSLENYIETAMSEIAPNICTLAGHLLGARLIALAGGLQNLAKMPASTIQVLGAERALFRALKSGSRPPKHGIIFQHSLFHEVKRWQRGKVARALAGKLAIAARIDAFSGSRAGDKLKGALDKRIKEIQEKYAKPPPSKKVSFKKYKRLKKKRRKKRDDRG